MLLRDIALRMAIRHPRVGEILSNEVTEEHEMELLADYGLVYKKPFSFINDGGLLEFRHSVATIELIQLYPEIQEQGLHFTVAFDTMMLVSNEKEPLTKLLPTGQNKGGLMLGKINFDWYDHVKIYHKSQYSIDPTLDTKSQIKKNNDILHDYILNIRWFELLQL